MAAILGVLMLKLITSNQAGADWTSSFSFVAINLCVGLSLLFVPLTTKSLISDGMTQVASGLAAAPAYAALGSAKIAAKSAMDKTKGLATFGARPVSNYLERKAKPITDRVQNAKEWWSNAGKKNSDKQTSDKKRT